MFDFDNINAKVPYEIESTNPKIINREHVIVLPITNFTNILSRKTARLPTSGNDPITGMKWSDLKKRFSYLKRIEK